MDCSTNLLLESVFHGDIAYVLLPDGSTDLEASSTQATTYVSTTGSPNRNQTCVFVSTKLSFVLPPWLNI
eukprot:430716-Ditylum_brightwellii.AAC.1